MGFFDKKKRTDEVENTEEAGGQPVETFRTAEAQRTSPPPPPPPDASDPLEVSQSDMSLVENLSESIQSPAVDPPHRRPGETAFGIEDAVLLMRQLPTRNMELVVQVVKKTLESVNVDVSGIVESATARERVIEARIATLKKEIENLEIQINASKKEILQLETEQREVATVKDRLVLAQRIEGESAATERAALRPPASTSAATPQTASSSTGAGLAPTFPPPQKS